MRQTRVAFIKAQWWSEIVDQALVGFEAEAEATEIDTFDVPGAFEMPLLAKTLAKTGQYDAIVCAALVADSGIYRHEFVAQAVVTGLMDVQLQTDVPTFSVSLTPHQFNGCKEHLEFFREHFVKKGKEAASAVNRVVAQRRTFFGE